MTPEERARLRSLAEKATPGPWRLDDEDNGIIWPDIVPQGSTDKIMVSLYGLPNASTGAFIAAASPDVILSLLDQVETLTETLNMLRGDLEDDQK